MKNSLRSVMTLSALTLTLTLGACATTDWKIISDAQEIADTRSRVSKPYLDLNKVIVVRLKRQGERIGVSSLAPEVVGAATGGPLGARTLFALSPDKTRLVLFGQNVPKLIAFYKEIPLAELVPGKAFRFPVVQPDGQVLEQEFTVEQVIDKVPD